LSDFMPLELASRDEVILITGISGSGKSVAHGRLAAQPGAADRPVAR
jgi:adenylylsulfate kinase-like enzyme